MSLWTCFAIFRSACSTVVMAQGRIFRGGGGMGGCALFRAPKTHHYSEFSKGRGGEGGGGGV